MPPACVCQHSSLYLMALFSLQLWLLLLSLLCDITNSFSFKCKYNLSHWVLFLLFSDVCRLFHIFNFCFNSISLKWGKHHSNLTTTNNELYSMEKALEFPWMEIINFKPQNLTKKKNYNPAACGPKTTVTERQRRWKGRGLCTRWRNKKKPQKNN